MDLLQFSKFLPHYNTFLFFCLMFIISNLPFSVSEIKNTHISRDSRPMILFERFGFSEGGHVDVTIKDVSWKLSRNQKLEFDPSMMGFFLARDIAFNNILNESLYKDRFCVLSSRYVTLVFRFDSLTDDSVHNGSAAIGEPDQYSLIFGNCQPEFEVSMNIHTEMYNIQHGTKDFLPAGQTILPKFYFMFFIIYTGFFITWFFICIKQRPAIDKIHIIMAALLLFKALKMICASEDKMYVGKTGSPHGWDVAFYIFGFFKGIMLFTVIILIGTGWSFLKPYLQDRERNVLMIVIPLQVLENIAYVVISETGPATKDWMAWNQMFLLIDVICCCAVFFPIIWSIRSLREASKMDGKAARNLKKLSLFKQFYIVVVVYLYFTRVVVSSVGTLLDYRFEWITNALAEFASLAFYVFIFYNFQPTERNPYLVIDDEEETAAAQILEEDDSFEL